MNGRPVSKEQLQPALRIAVLAVAVLAVGVLGYRQIDRWRGEPAWVAAAYLQPGALVGPDDLEEVRLATQRLPKGAFRDRRQIVGRQLTRVKEAGKPFVAADFAPPREDPGSITRLVPEGRVLATLQISPTSIPYPELRRGDRLEVVAANRKRGDAVAHDVYFVGWIKPKPEKETDGGRAGLLSQVLRPARQQGGGGVTLMLALHPDDVIPMAQAQASAARLSLVLHGRDDVKAGNLRELPSPEGNEVELIAGPRREKVAL